MLIYGNPTTNNYEDSLAIRSMCSVVIIKLNVGHCNLALMNSFISFTIIGQRSSRGTQTLSVYLWATSYHRASTIRYVYSYQSSASDSVFLAQVRRNFHNQDIAFIKYAFIVSYDGSQNGYLSKTNALKKHLNYIEFAYAELNALFCQIIVEIQFRLN